MYYQYLSSRHAITNLERKMVKVSRIKAVNDLFELQPYLRFDKEKRGQFRKIRTRVADTYGMVCFSTDWQEPIMWGHYADRNKGIVLGFEFISDRFVIKEVKYSEEIEQVALDPLFITLSEYIEAVGFIKYKGWSYEKEYRFFVKLDDCIRIEENYFIEFGGDLRLREVIIGPEHPSKNKKNYTKTASYIIALVKQNSAKLIVSRAEFGGYKIRTCGFWTPRFKKILKA